MIVEQQANHFLSLKYFCNLFQVTFFLFTFFPVLGKSKYIVMRNIN